MARPRSTRSFQRRAPRRPTTWDATAPALVNMAAAASLTVIDITAQAIANSEEQTGTIRRLIGGIRIMSDDTATRVDFAAGISVVTEDALAAGQVPDPLSDLEQDWYWWRRGILDVPASPAGLVQPPFWELDNKTARRLRAGFRLALVLEKGVSSIALDISVSMRGLWNMP